MSVRLPDQLPRVTPRQLEVARLVSRGLTNPQIAEELGITLDGAKYHVAELLGRLGLSTRDQIAEWYSGEERRRRTRRMRLLFAPLGWALAGSAATLAALLVVAALRGASVVPSPASAPISAPSFDAEGRADVALDTGFAREGASWSRAFVGSSTQLDAPRLTPADDGGVFVGATFGTEAAGGSIDLGGGPIVSAGGWDGALARLTVDGELVWSRRLGGAGLDGVSDVAADGAGGVVAVGRYTGAIDLGSGPLVDGGVVPTTWLARFDRNGSTRWSETLARGHLDVAAVASLAGGIVVAGAFTGTVEVGGRSLTAAGDRDLVVAAFDGEGALLWLRAVGGDGHEQDVQLATVEDGLVVAATLGRVLETNTLAGGYRESALLLVALDAGGAERWRRTFSGPGTALAAAGLDLTDDAEVVLAASLRGAVDLGGSALESDGIEGRDIVLARLDAHGGTVWSRRFGAASDDAPLALALDDDRLIVSGIFRGALDLGRSVLESSLNSDGMPSQNGFLASFSLDGDQLTGRVFGAPRSARGQALAVGERGDLFAAGRFLGLVDVGAGRLLSTQSFLDSFIARIEP